MARRRNAVENLSTTFSNLSISYEPSSPGSENQPSQRRSPIDEYFLQHAAQSRGRFTYDSDANIDINETFRVLARALKWKEKKRSKEREKFFEAVDLEFTTMFGDGNNLQTWQRLVGMFGFDRGKIPNSITKCKKILRRYFINIYDFLQYFRRVGGMNIDHDEDEIQRDLRSLNKGSLQNLRDYSKESRRLFPLDYARGSVLKAFLVHMF